MNDTYKEIRRTRGCAWPDRLCDASCVREETRDERHKRWAHDSDCFDRFKELWSQYQSALAVDTFAMTKEEREQNQSEVERCFEALNRLAKEGA